MRPEDQTEEPFPKDDLLWGILGRSRGVVESGEVLKDRSDAVVRGVMDVVRGERKVLRVAFRRSAWWGVAVGVAASVVVAGMALFLARAGGVNAEVNALASFAESSGIDLSGGDQFLIAHLDELLETDVHALWLESSAQ